MTKYTRRELLRFTSANIALGVATGTSVARDSAESMPDPNTTPDFRVRNQSSDPVSISVNFFEAADGERTTKSPELSVVSDLETESTAVVEEQLPLSGGRYIVEVVLDNGMTEQTMWTVPPGGVADWLTFSVRVRKTDDLSIGPIER